jgi:hypothetical protein
VSAEQVETGPAGGIVTRSRVAILTFAVTGTFLITTMLFLLVAAAR